jgi:TolB protein
MHLALIVLIALAGCGGGDGGSGPDTDPPSVTISAPASGATVSGDVMVSATASDDESVAGVQFEVDGEPLGAEDTESPYQSTWDASAATAGTHTLLARARDPSGNVGTSDSVEVTVSAPTGAIQVTATTTGEGTDSDGYFVNVDGGGRGAVEANGTLLVEDLPSGPHTVTLTGISPFCTPANGPTRQVTVGAEPVTASFVLACEAAPGGRIAFTAVASAAGPLEIRTIHADGTGETTVVTETEGDFATWSPDGTQIAFIRWVVGSAILYRVNADGTGLTEVATLPGFAEELDWGSGGTLVFSAPREGESFPDLFFIEADGSDLRPVFSDAAYRLSPSWSPDGTRLVFAAVQADGDNTELTLVNADGSSPEPLTSGSRDLSASWSPDATTLAFRRYNLDSGMSEIWVIGTDGSGLRKLVDTNGPQFSPSWSPDGGWVAFTSENASGQPLLIARADGSDVMQVPGAFQFSGQPEWGPRPE